MTGTRAAAAPLSPTVPATIGATADPDAPSAAKIATPRTRTTASALVATRPAETPSRLITVNTTITPTPTAVAGERTIDIGPKSALAIGVWPSDGTVRSTYAAMPAALAAIAPEKPAMNDVHPERNPAIGSNASRR